MHARVASFEGRDPSRTDELIEKIRERGPSTVPEGVLGAGETQKSRALSAK